MIYLLIAAILTGFAAGFGLEYKLDESKIIGYETAIQVANKQADDAKKLNETNLKLAQDEAKTLNDNLDKAHEDQAKAIANLNATFTGRLRDPGKTRSCYRVPKSGDTKVDTTNANDNAELSIEATAFLRGEALRADTCAIDKSELLTFIRTNCGVKQ